MAHALIVGGSLGGLFTALLLRQAGWDVTVFERSAGDLSGRGAGVGTHAELFDVMRQLGIAVDESIGVPITSRICLDRDGGIVARLPFEKILTSWALIYRSLRRRLPDASYRPGMQLDDIVQRAGGVTAVFADGTTADGDLLVGADGLHSTVRKRAFAHAAPPRYAGYIAWRGGVDERAVPARACAELIDAYGFFVTPREMVLSYWQPGTDDDHRPGRRRLNWLWYHPVSAAALRDLSTDASGRHHDAGIPPPLIRPEASAAFRNEARATLPPQFVTLIDATPAPFFQPIYDLDSPRLVAGRAVLVGDAASVARPHVGAGVSKAALNASWLAAALAVTADHRSGYAAGGIDAGLTAYEQRARSFGSAMVARARFLGAYLEDPPRDGLKPDPVSVMQAISAPLREIPELADAIRHESGRGMTATGKM